jgi:hypothetical protein
MPGTMFQVLSHGTTFVKPVWKSPEHTKVSNSTFTNFYSDNLMTLQVYFAGVFYEGFMK